MEAQVAHQPRAAGNEVARQNRGVGGAGDAGVDLGGDGAQGSLPAQQHKVHRCGAAVALGVEPERRAGGHGQELVDRARVRGGVGGRRDVALVHAVRTEDLFGDVVQAHLVVSQEELHARRPEQLHAVAAVGEPACTMQGPS